VSEWCYRNWLWLCFTFRLLMATPFSHSSFISGVTLGEIKYSIIMGPQYVENRILKFIFHIILDRLLGDVWTINLHWAQKWGRQMWVSFELLVISVLGNECKQSGVALWWGLLVPTSCWFMHDSKVSTFLSFLLVFLNHSLCMGLSPLEMKFFKGSWLLSCRQL
jgi:hypothetical protein